MLTRQTIRGVIRIRGAVPFNLVSLLWQSEDAKLLSVLLDEIEVSESLSFSVASFSVSSAQGGATIIAVRSQKLVKSARAREREREGERGRVRGGSKEGQRGRDWGPINRREANTGKGGWIRPALTIGRIVARFLGAVELYGDRGLGLLPRLFTLCEKQKAKINYEITSGDGGAGAIVV
jgi:hypothetical protein